MQVLGETVTYTPSGGDPVSLNAIVDYNVTPVEGLYGEVGERRNEITLRKTDVSGANRGDAVMVNAVAYTLQDLIEDDGIVERWSLRYV